MAYVIRSMSTTDMRPGVPVVPYHVYLMPREKRLGAWWSTEFHAQRFETLEEAEAEWRRSFPNKVLGTQDIAPVDCAVPVWEAKHHVPGSDEDPADVTKARLRKWGHGTGAYR